MMLATTNDLIVRPNTAPRLNEIDPTAGYGEDDVGLLEETIEIEQASASSGAIYDELIVQPGAQVRLRDIDPGYHANHESPETAMPKTLLLLQRLDHLQYLMFVEKKHSLLIIFQGMDASGKDAVIRHLFRGMDPTGTRVMTFKEPTSEELAHDFLWRVRPHLPANGHICLFNRSHYEDVLIVRVHNLDHATLWFKRYDMINDFERLVATDNNTTVLKFLLFISKEEQLARFRRRLEDPAKHWKISEADYRERKHWGHYIAAFEDMLLKTSTSYAPWFVIPSDCKWFRDLAVTQIVVRTLERLQMNCPEPSLQVTDLIRRYHNAELEIEAS